MTTKKVVLAVLTGVLCLSLGSLRARADETGSYDVASARTHKKMHVAQVGQNNDSESSDSSASLPNDYINIGKIGVGPSLDIADLPALSGAAASSLGTIDGRYWVNRQFGFDLGMGFGFPQVSPTSTFLGGFRAEGMIAIKETKHNVFYADAEIIPAFLSGGGSSPFFMALQGGVGLEHAMSEIPNLSLYTEWDPIAFNVYSPGGGASSEIGLGFLGSVMNFGTGLRYYF